MDDAPQSVYDPIGVAWQQPTGWSAMNEYFVKDEIAQYGPVTAGFGVPNDFGSFFSSNPQGVYKAQANQGTHGGHSVAIVGWGMEGSQKYWLVRNSWARDWAYGGFFKIEIGGNSAAGDVGFASAHQGLGAIAPFFKSGSARRLVQSVQNNNMSVTHPDQQVAENQSVSTHGSPTTCNNNHDQAIGYLRTWFLANKTNYNGVKPNCAVPWTYESSAMCTAKITEGLTIQTILHVKDCDNELYHWTVQWEWPIDDIRQDAVGSAKIMSNDGPWPQVDMSVNISGTGTDVTPKNQTGTTTGTAGETSGATIGRTMFATMMVLLGYFHINAF
jgi:hypothetical protein